MRQPSFRKLLLKFASPRLKFLEFEYDKSSLGRSDIVGFGKFLPGNVIANIEFQPRRINEVDHGYSFTVNLSRYRLDESGGKSYLRTEGDFGARLGSLIVNAYGLWLYPYWDHWWEAHSPEQLEAALDDALGRFERYALPVMEGRDFRDVLPSGMPDEWDAFHDTVESVVGPGLSELGFQSVIDPYRPPSPTHKPQRHFVRQLEDDFFAYVKILNVKCMICPQLSSNNHPMRYMAILIARKRSDNINSEIDPRNHDSFQGWLGPSSLDRASVKPIISDAAFWGYEEAGLTLQLSAALGKIKRDGLRLLESS